MRIASFVLGLVGGLLGFAATFVELGIAGFSVGSGGSGGVLLSLLPYLILLTFLLSVLGIVGGGLSLGPRRKTAAWVLLVAAIGGFVTSLALWFPAGVLLLVGSLLRFYDRSPVE